MKLANKKVKHFLDVDSMWVYEVPEKHWWNIDLINDRSGRFGDWQVNEAKIFLVENCKMILSIDAMTQTL